MFFLLIVKIPKTYIRMKKYILFILVLYFSNISYSQLSWKWLHPKPQGNTLNYAKVFSAEEWIAVGNNGTFMSTTNSGVNWFISHNADGFKPDDYSFLWDAWFFNMTTGIVCGSTSQIWRTTNGGISFDSVSSNIGTGVDLKGIHFINTATGYIGCSNGDILKTTNSGTDWDRIITGSNAWIRNISAIDKRLYCPASQSLILTSFDEGETWFRDTVSNSPIVLFDVAFRDTLNGMVCGMNFAAYTSNAGASWQQCNGSLAPTSFQCVTYSNGNWYLTGNPKWIYKSSDNGVSWDSLNFLGHQYYSGVYNCLDIMGTNFFTCGDNGLLNASSNNGANWISFNYFGNRGYLIDIWCDNMSGKVIAVGTPGPTPFLISTNGGMNWIFSAGKGITTDVYSLSMLNSLTGFACGTFGKVFRTIDGGLTWDSLTSIENRIALGCADFIDVNTGFVCDLNGRIYKTINGGNSWILISEFYPQTDYKLDMLNAQTGWIAGGSGICRFTSNGGLNWIEQTSNTNSSIRDLQMIDTLTGFIAGYSGTLRKTTNGGINWDTITTPYNINYRSLSFVNSNTGYIAGEYGITARTSNGGQSWEIKNSGAGSLYSVYCKGYDSAFIAGAGSVVLEQFNSLTGGITWHNQVPEEFTLEQNYPNPFNPVTTIKFGLPKTARVTLKVYDILGREVSVLFNNAELNAGTVLYNFDATDLASGVYFYSLDVNDTKVDTKRMVVLK